jgi:phage terminase Nu1 subunit (DNA packaging protein)
MSEWRDKMPIAPKLAHSDGMVVVMLGGRPVLFPSEADARFFHEAYNAVPALEAEVKTLRAEIDEGELHKARARALELEAERDQLRREVAELQERNRTEVERRTAATQRATVLRKALLRKS